MREVCSVSSYLSIQPSLPVVFRNQVAMSVEKEDMAVNVKAPPPQQPAPTNLKAILLAVFIAFGGLLLISHCK